MGWLGRLLYREPKPPAPPVPPPIRIAGISVICSRLGLHKNGPGNWQMGREMVVAMNSGRDAIYRYAETKYNWDVDWCWHNFEFVRYAGPTDLARDLPRY